jgi:uncharacterized protein (DUF697 family)
MAPPKKRKPSFDPPAGPNKEAESGWVYRTDDTTQSRPSGRAKAAAPPSEPKPQPSLRGSKVSDILPRGGYMSLKEIGAQKIVNKYALGSGAVSLVPIPLLDIAAITAVQVKMVTALAAHYGVPMDSGQWIKTGVASLIAGVAPNALAAGMAGEVIRQLPIVGSILSIAVVPGFAMAVSYATGKVFIAHFEAGGTLLNFDPEAVRQHFADEFKAAKA